jgi:hypothetical protein
MKQLALQLVFDSSARQSSDEEGSACTCMYLASSTTVNPKPRFWVHVPRYVASPVARHVVWCAAVHPPKRCAHAIRCYPAPLPSLCLGPWALGVWQAPHTRAGTRAVILAVKALVYSGRNVQEPPGEAALAAACPGFCRRAGKAGTGLRRFANRSVHGISSTGSVREGVARSVGHLMGCILRCGVHRVDGCCMQVQTAEILTDPPGPP